MLHVGWFSGRIGVTDAAECETRGPEIRRKNMVGADGTGSSGKLDKN